MRTRALARSYIQGFANVVCTVDATVSAISTSSCSIHSCSKFSCPRLDISVQLVEASFEAVGELTSLLLACPCLLCKLSCDMVLSELEEVCCSRSCETKRLEGPRVSTPTRVTGAVPYKSSHLALMDVERRKECKQLRAA